MCDGSARVSKAERKAINFQNETGIDIDSAKVKLSLTILKVKFEFIVFIDLFFFFIVCMYVFCIFYARMLLWIIIHHSSN